MSNESSSSLSGKLDVAAEVVESARNHRRTAIRLRRNAPYLIYVLGGEHTLQQIKRTFARIAALSSAIVLLGAAPQPLPDFSSFMFYMGTWECSPNASGRPVSHTAETTIGFNGTWMIERDTPPGIRYLTYDKSIGRWVEVGVSGKGGYWMASSPGWHGNAILFTTKWLDGSWQIDTITKDSNEKRHDNYRGIDAKGKAYAGTSYCAKTKA